MTVNGQKPLIIIISLLCFNQAYIRIWMIPIEMAFSGTGLFPETIPGIQKREKELSVSYAVITNHSPYLCISWSVAQETDSLFLCI